MFYRQLQYVGSNYACTLAILTQTRGTDLFFAISALFIVNGWIGSFFINRISSARGLHLATKDGAALAASLAGYGAYSFTFVPFEVALFMTFALLVRISHDFFRKRLFLTGNAPEWMPSIMKLSILVIFVVELKPLNAAFFYTAIYGISLTYYWFKIKAVQVMPPSPFQEAPMGGDIFVALRVGYRNLALMYLPWAYPGSATIEGFLYWWTVLAVLSTANDMIERYALRAVLPLSRWLEFTAAVAAFCIIALSLAALPETLILIALVLTRQVVIGFENYRYVLERQAGNLARLYPTELLKIGGAIALLVMLLWLGVAVIWVLALFMIWEVAIGFLFVQALTPGRDA